MNKKKVTTLILLSSVLCAPAANCMQGGYMMLRDTAATTSPVVDDTSTATRSPIVKDTSTDAELRTAKVASAVGALGLAGAMIVANRAEILQSMKDGKNAVIRHPKKSIGAVSAAAATGAGIYFRRALVNAGLFTAEQLMELIKKNPTASKIIAAGAAGTAAIGAGVYGLYKLVSKSKRQLAQREETQRVADERAKTRREETQGTTQRITQRLSQRAEARRAEARRADAQRAAEARRAEARRADARRAAEAQRADARRQIQARIESLQTEQAGLNKLAEERPTRYAHWKIAPKESLYADWVKNTARVERELASARAELARI